MAVWAAVALLHIDGAQAQAPVSIELVLAVDTSMSVDGFEYGLLMKGIANAFRTPEIVNLIVIAHPRWSYAVLKMEFPSSVARMA